VGEDPLQSTDRVLHVDGRSFVSFDSIVESSGMLEEGAEQDAAAIDERIEWLETTELGSSEEHALLEILVVGSDLFRPFALLDELEGIEPGGIAELEDGTPTDRYTATVSGERFFSALGLDDPVLLFGAVPDGAELTVEEREELRRTEDIYRYGMSRTSLDVELEVDARGQLRRTVMSVRYDAEERYADCLELEEFAPSLRLSADYADLGSAVEIEAPPAEAVIGPDEAVERHPDHLAALDAEEWEEAFSEDPYFDEDGGLRTIGTVHGERAVAAVEDDLLKFGSVIDLDEDAVFDMTPEELAAAYDRASAVLAAMPRTTTLMGELTRVELLFNVQLGMEEEGIDPSTAESLTDQQLGALIDAYVAELGIYGDGVWGDPQVGDVPPEWWEEDLDDDGLPDSTDEDVEDLYEGCPGGDDEGSGGRSDDAGEADPATEPANFD